MANSNRLAESFYYVNYGSSIITSKVRQKNISNENIKQRNDITKNSSFWHFNSRFVLETTETPVFSVFITEIICLTFDAIIDDP